MIAKFIGTKASDWDTLAGKSDVLTGWADEVAEAFYGILMDIPEAAAILTDAGGSLDTRKSVLADWYKELVTEIPRIEDGYIYPMEGPGLGTKLLPDIAKRADATIRRTSLDDQ